MQPERGAMTDRVAWESVQWRRGEDSFRFDIERGGLFATLSAPGGRSMTLPIAVWDALLDAIKASRTARTRSEQQFPTRARARWYEGESAELAEAFKSGRSVAQLARAHNRTEFAIESQLDRMGLVSNAERYGSAAPAASTDARLPVGTSAEAPKIASRKSDRDRRI